MTALFTEIAEPVGSAMITDANVGATIQADKGGVAPRILELEINNVNNSTPVYFKMWDAVAVVIGTDPPQFKFKVKEQGALKIYFPRPGLALTTALSYGCFTESAITGNVGPVRPVEVKILLA
jgi:hypothetical protein